MNILSVDTATIGMFVSIIKDGNVEITEYSDDMRNQAGALLPFIVRALKISELDFIDLDALVVAIGPGSFTGIRVGLSAMQGIALAATKPLIGFNSFEIYNFLHKYNNTDGMLVVLESRRKEAFCQLYDMSGMLYGNPFQADAESIPSYLPDWERIFVTGNAITILHELADCSRYKINKASICSKENYSSEVLCEILTKRLKNTTLEDIAKIYPATPFYIRPPDITISNKY